MLKKNILLISFILLILSGCNNDDVPMYFRSLQPSGGSIFNGNIKERIINSLPKQMYIGSKDFKIDSTYSDKEADAEFVVIDLNQKWEVSKNDFKSKSSNSGFIGEELTSRVTHTISGKNCFINS